MGEQALRLVCHPAAGQRAQGQRLSKDGWEGPHGCGRYVRLGDGFQEIFEISPICLHHQDNK